MTDGAAHEQLTWRVPGTLLTIFCATWLALAIAPLDRSDWLLENLLVLVTVPTLVATRHRLRFSNAAYVCLFVFFMFHAVGSHYTYAMVPYDAWAQNLTGHSVSEWFGWKRNHYDRLVHLIYGALMLLPAVELFDAIAGPRGAWKWLMPYLFVTSHAPIYEIIEWGAAIIVAPDLGNAYLGTQGDIWDAQKDMALAMLGSLLALPLVWRWQSTAAHR